MKLLAFFRTWIHKPTPILAVVILYTASIFGFGYTHDASVKVQHQAERIQDLANLDCPRRADARAASRVIGLTVRSIVATTGQPVDYKQIPGYNEVEPAMRTFLDNLALLSTASGGFRDQALASIDAALADLQPIVCPIT